MFKSASPLSAHLPAEFYTAITSTLYRLFGSVGALLQVGAVVAAGVLAFLVRGRPAFRLTALGASCLVLSLVLWFVLVSPVNAAWAEALASAPASAPAVYERLRPRWEYGHGAAFVAWLAGFGLLLLSVVRETPTHRSRSHSV